MLYLKPIIDNIEGGESVASLFCRFYVSFDAQSAELDA